MSSAVSTEVSTEGGESTRRRLSSRQAATLAKLTDAALDELREVGFDALTIRHVAARAGVAPATAYTYFSSREHLVTELFWRRLADLPPTPVDRRRKPAVRVSALLSDLALLVADEPELAAACTVAMLSTDPDVRLLRDRIGVGIRRRILDVLVDDSTPEVVSALELVVSGALLHAGTGHLDYSDLPARLHSAADLILGAP